MRATAVSKRPALRALRMFTLLAALASCRPDPVTIRAGLLLDGRGGEARDVLVTISGDRISGVAPWRGEPVTWDLSRYTLLPGLIDGHVHIGSHFNAQGRIASGNDGETADQRAAARAANALATLNAGFTTVVSMGAGSDRELRDRINRGEVPGPRLLSSLAQIQGAGESPDSLRQEVRAVAGRGADLVKIFASRSIRDGGGPALSREQLSALCHEAGRLRLRSAVHAHDDSSIVRAAAAGCDQVEHGFLATAASIRILADSGRAFDPQCGLIIRNYLEHRASYEVPGGFRADQFEAMERVLPRLPGVLRDALATPGLRVLYGTDATAGAHGRNAEDLVCRVREAGEAPMHALVSATSLNAGALGLDRVIGTVAPGFQADLIALEGNPLEEIEAVRRVRFVMKGGKVYRSPTAGSAFLYLWTAAADSTSPDFLAVYDVRPDSGRYGALLTTLPVPGRGNGPHHTEHEMPADGQLFANGFGSGQSFIFDLTTPAAPRLAGQFGEVQGLHHPHSFVRLPGGNVLATFQMSHDSLGEAPGGLAELTPAGTLVRSASASAPGVPRGLRPYSAVVVPALDRIVATTTDMDEKNPYQARELQLWRLSDLRLLHTFTLPPGPRGDEADFTAEPRLLADGRTVLVSTFNCGLYRLEGLDTDRPAGRLVASFPRKPGTSCAIPVVSGRWYLATVPAIPAVVSLDISDPAAPREVGRLVLDSADVPHWISLEPGTRRLVITGYGALAHRVLIATFDSTTGALALDGRFRPPGATAGFTLPGKAVPHGAVFSRPPPEQ